MTKQAIIMIGCSASGKSTAAQEYVKQGYFEVNRDNFRVSLLNTIYKDSGYTHQDNMWKYWNFKWEKAVTDLVNSQLQYSTENNVNIVISDTNLNPDKTKSLQEKLESMGYIVSTEVHGLDLGLEELWTRDEKRKDTVGRKVIADQYIQFRKQFPRYLTIKDTSLPSAVIFDVDGTLAHMDGKRGAFEWDKVDVDTPDKIVISSLIAQHMMGHQIIVMSGRDGVCREKTEEWVSKHIRDVSTSMFGDSIDIEFELHMRAPDDMRSDAIVKNELYFAHVDGKYNVVCAFDDRPKVCLMWYDLGLKVIHCANPYIFF